MRLFCLHLNLSYYLSSSIVCGKTLELLCYLLNVPSTCKVNFDARKYCLHPQFRRSRVKGCKPHTSKSVFSYTPQRVISHNYSDGAPMQANDNVTGTLRRTIGVMQGELERSVLATQMLGGPRPFLFFPHAHLRNSQTLRQS